MGKAQVHVHVLTHVLHYGLGVFEGIRCSETVAGDSAVFHLTGHMERLDRSARMLLMDVGRPVGEMVEVVKETIRANGLRSCYIRPLVFRGYGSMGLDPIPAPVNVTVAVWPWGTYLARTR